MLPMPPPIPAPSPGDEARRLSSPADAQGAAWASVLQTVGWPADVVVIDFETYFDQEYSLSKLSTIEYIEDARYEELGVAVLVVPKDQPFAPRVAHFWPDVEAELTWLKNQYGPNLERCTVVIQNARFDGSILVRKHATAPPFVVDTIALSRHQDARNKHGLKDQCLRWNLPPKGDTMQFSGLHRADLTDDQAVALARYACNDAEREMDLFEILLPRLTRPEVELPLTRHTLRLFWEPELCFDFAEADRLAGLMEAQVVKDVTPLGVTAAEISGNKTFVALLAEALAITGETVPMKQGKRKMIAALAKDDSAVTALKRHRTPRVRELIKARQAVKSWPLHIKRLHAMSDQAKAAGGRLPNPLNYYGASTGRWSGGEGINTCNLPARETQ